MRPIVGDAAAAPRVQRAARGRGAEMALVGALAAAVFVVHDVGYLLGHPFWVDEAWVAITTRMPLHELRTHTASTPIGWALLQRLIVIGGPQRFRMLTLLFAGLVVVAGYLLARLLPWPTRRAALLAGSLAGLVALLQPAALDRNDLKQYTADAFCTLVVFGLVSGLEASWSTGRLVRLAALVGAGMLLSDAAAFAGFAAFSSLAVLAMARRQWGRLRAVCLCGAAAGAGILAVYRTFDSANLPAALRAYWRPFYPPASFGGLFHFMLSKGHTLLSFLGFGPIWLAAPVVAAGLVTLWRMQRPATALLVPVLVAEMVGLGLAQRYPLFDPRTSDFLVSAVGVLGAIGIAGLVIAGWRAPAAGRGGAGHRGGPVRHVPVTHRSARTRRGRAVTAAGLALAVAGFGAGSSRYLHRHSLPAEDVRAQVRYVEAHRAPGDVVLMNLSANWGFGYYWRGAGPSLTPDSVVAQGYIVDYPVRDGIIVSRDRTAAAIGAALSEARSLAAARPGGHRIWLVLSHDAGPESGVWAAALRGFLVRTINVGPEPLRLLLSPGPSSRSG
ncbi:MAG TPA: hypothetical protein VNE21_03920 [Mycobacteriales bacterium]|nr:hypothetical protein [Mycobacteriales bacterium]